MKVGGLVLAYVLITAVPAPGSAFGAEPTHGASTAAVSPMPATASADSVETLRMARRIVMERAPARGALSALAEAAVTIPGDDWIVGHQVGLLLGHDEPNQALAVARSCRASRWWCEMLTGDVLHTMGFVVEAEAAFDVALEAMPTGERCSWTTELRYLLEPGAYREIRPDECGREAFDAELRMWRLADPLWTRPGNDRRTEHFARMVATRLHHQYLELHNDVCTPGHHQEVLEAGWSDPLWGYRSTRTREWAGYRFLPSADLLRDPLGAGPSEWVPARASSREVYDPPYGPIHDLRHQTAFFLRGDSVRVAAAIELAGHPIVFDAPLEASLVLARVADAAPIAVLAPTSDLDGRTIWESVVPVEPHLVGVEVLGERRAGARARFAHSPPEVPEEGIGLSDLLLFDRYEGLGEELEEVLPRMLGTSEVFPGRQVGLFWETYGLDADDEIIVRLTVSTAERGIFRRLGEAFRLLSPAIGVQTAWEELPDTRPGHAGRSLGIDLSGLSAGAYVIEVEVETSAGATAVARREIVIPG